MRACYSGTVVIPMYACRSGPRIGSAYPVSVELPVDLDELRAILRRHGIVFALLFGSRARGRAHLGSDVDVAVWAPEPLDDWSLGADLPDGVDVVDLRTAADGLAGRIALEGVPLLDDDPPLRIRWQAQTRKRHLDEAVRRDRFRQDFVAAHG
jgi:predicted nucleotidyltransferase